MKVNQLRCWRKIKVSLKPYWPLEVITYLGELDTEAVCFASTLVRDEDNTLEDLNQTFNWSATEERLERKFHSFSYDLSAIHAALYRKYQSGYFNKIYVLEKQKEIP